MAVVAQITKAHAGEPLKLYGEPGDITTALANSRVGDHLTLYPGYYEDYNIKIPTGVSVTVLPGARLNYNKISGDLSNIADLNKIDRVVLLENFDEKADELLEQITTDEIVEGGNNLFFTDERAVTAASDSGEFVSSSGGQYDGEFNFNKATISPIGLGIRTDQIYADIHIRNGVDDTSIQLLETIIDDRRTTLEIKTKDGFATIGTTTDTPLNLISNDTNSLILESNSVTSNKRFIAKDGIRGDSSVASYDGSISLTLNSDTITTSDLDFESVVSPGDIIHIEDIPDSPDGTFYAVVIDVVESESIRINRLFPYDSLMTDSWNRLPVQFRISDSNAEYMQIRSDGSIRVGDPLYGGSFIDNHWKYGVALNRKGSYFLHNTPFESTPIGEVEQPVLIQSVSGNGEVNPILWISSSIDATDLDNPKLSQFVISTDVDNPFQNPNLLLTDNSIGIFNDNPTEALDVVGNIKVSGNVIVDGNVDGIDLQQFLSTFQQFQTDLSELVESRVDEVLDVSSGIEKEYDPSFDKISIKHADTSTQQSLSNSGNTFIQSIELDEFGHVIDMIASSVGLSDYFHVSNDNTITGSNIFDGNTRFNSTVTLSSGYEAQGRIQRAVDTSQTISAGGTYQIDLQSRFDNTTTSSDCVIQVFMIDQDTGSPTYNEWIVATSDKITIERQDESFILHNRNSIQRQVKVVVFYYPR